MNKLYSIFLILLLVFACNKSDDNHQSHSDQKQEQVKTYYTCSMHPQIKQNEPGKCPICHMNLTKVEAMETSDTSQKVAEPKKELWQCENYLNVTSEQEDICPIDGTPMVKVEGLALAQKVVGEVKLRKSQLNHFDPAFFPVTKMKMNKNIRLLGTVLQSEDKESNIPARVGGRVEKVYVKSTGSLIQKGDPVVDIYSPQLITAGEEYLIARKSYEDQKKTEFKEMVRQAQERLRLWGVRESQYESWYKNEKVPKSITIYSPATGIVQKRNAIVGKYFEEGQNFFELSDLSDVWVEIDVYEHDSALVKLGQQVEMQFSALPGEVLTGEIDFIDPVLNTQSRTLKVRTTIPNSSGKLKPGMIADVNLKVAFEGLSLVVPRTAVIDTGKRKVVWIKVNDSQFQAKEIHTGRESEGYIEVKHGLMEGEEVVIEGNFLIDAQTQLFGGYEDVNSEAATGHNH